MDSNYWQRSVVHGFLCPALNCPTQAKARIEWADRPQSPSKMSPQVTPFDRNHLY